MILTDQEYLMHYGILRRSGRYPWGSGETQSQRNQTFLDMVDDLRSKGMSETEVAAAFKLTTTELRAVKSIAKNEEKQARIGEARRLSDKGYSNVAIGKKLGIPESSVRNLLKPGEQDKADVLQATTRMLKDQVAKKKYIDVGVGVERHIGVSDTKLRTAVAALKEEGYKLYYVNVEQLGTGKQTKLKVLTGPDTTFGDVYKNRGNIRTVTEISEDGGRTYLGITPPKSIKSNRVGVRYAEEGGTDADGVIYVRPGVKDLSLGKSRYAQVRVAVDDTHYLKGMAMYKDGLPDGVDLLFNTNKRNTGNKLDAMKKMADDPDNPFGATITRQHGVMNIVNEEGAWSNWSRSLSSQMLSKQSPALALSQLNMTYERKRRELDDILALTNPSVKRRLLEAFADDADSSAVHLKAAALPRQGSHVILPVNSLGEHEIYAPNYRSGERVVLIRYPHGGIFEIPELTVNNRHQEARKLLGSSPRDAVGINSKVAERLSGADFDGDTVLVIPNNDRKIKTAKALEGLKNFDPIRAYPGYEGMPRMSSRTKGIEMGIVSNLITDMTIKGATASEIARAVRHSMVVIDAEKHNLNYKQSALDNNIPQLKEKYQGGPRAGAATLISRAGASVRVPERKPRPAAKGGPIDRATGRRVYELTGETYTNAKGKTIVRTSPSKRLAETDDAFTLSSGTPIEKVYASHSNSLKALANEARRKMVRETDIPYSPSAKRAYAKEVASLDGKLNLALRNAPLERQAQVLAAAIVRQKRLANPDLEPSDIKKLKAQALYSARQRTGAGKQTIDITESEWKAIQAGAVSASKLNRILANADLETVKQLATPRTAPTMTPAKKARAQAMLASGYTQAEVADTLGVSIETLMQSGE